jgi:hypothetical protein
MIRAKIFKESVLAADPMRKWGRPLSGGRRDVLSLSVAVKTIEFSRNLS